MSEATNTLLKLAGRLSEIKQAYLPMPQAQPQAPVQDPATGMWIDPATGQPLQQPAPQQMPPGQPGMPPEAMGAPPGAEGMPPEAMGMPAEGEAAPEGIETTLYQITDAIGQLADAVEGLQQDAEEMRKVGKKVGELEHTLNAVIKSFAEDGR